MRSLSLPPVFKSRIPASRLLLPLPPLNDVAVSIPVTTAPVGVVLIRSVLL